MFSNPLKIPLNLLGLTLLFEFTPENREGGENSNVPVVNQVNNYSLTTINKVNIYSLTTINNAYSLTTAKLNIIC